MESEKIIPKSNKFLRLNFNLKNWIFSFLDFEEIIYLTKIHSEFNKSYKRSKIFKYLKESYSYLMFRINLSNNKLQIITNEFKSNFFVSEETYHQVYLYFLNKKYKNEKEISLKKTNFNTKIISNFISKHECIEKLILSENCFTKIPKSILELSKIFYKVTSLQILYLNENNIGLNETDMKYLCEGIKNNFSIKVLDLNWNEIGKNKYDVFYLSEALKINKKLENLFLFNNLIGNYNEDIQHISNWLDVNKTLKEIDLSWNMIGENENDFFIFSQKLKENKTLEILNITKNKIDNILNILRLKKDNPGLNIKSFYDNQNKKNNHII